MKTPSGITIRPMGVGQILDAGFTLVRSNFWLLAGIAAWGIVPPAVLTVVLNGLAWLGEATGVAFTAIALVLALLVAAGVALLYWLGLRSMLVAQAETAAAEQARRPSSGDALARSRQHAMGGRYREACHYLFLSVLLWLDESQLGRFDPSQFLYASDIPHGDREWESVGRLQERPDVTEQAKARLLAENARKFYGQ